MPSCSSSDNNPSPTVDTNQGFTERTRADFNKPKAPGYLCIYYGYPSLINGANGDVVAASAEFDKFHLIILGDGLWQTTHPDYPKTKSIITDLIAKKRLVFGYIDLGVSTTNLTESKLYQQIDGWKALGVSGVFFDNAGYDFKVTRERQNAVIQYCRQANMLVFVNAWNPDDVLADPNCLINENDYYLAESFLVGHDTYFALDAWKKKADAVYNYMKVKGIKVACVATGGETINQAFNTTDKFTLAWCGTTMYNFHYFQATNSLYSANNNIVKLFPNITESFGTNFLQVEISKESETHYFRKTDTNTIHIYGNGLSQGNGLITKP